MKSCLGFASHSDFVDMDETRITDCMADQDIIEVRKITKNVDGTKRSTASVILSFIAVRLLERVYVGYKLVAVRP